MLLYSRNMLQDSILVLNFFIELIELDTDRQIYSASGNLSKNEDMLMKLGTSAFCHRWA